MYEELKMTGSALTSLKAAFDLSKAFLDVKGAVDVQGKVFELQRVILSAQHDTFSAQEAQSALLKRVSDLEKEVTRLEAWDREKQRYELTKLGSGVLAYKLKPEPQAAEPEHYLCASCFENHRKSILQPETLDPGRAKVLVCHGCGAEIILEGSRQIGRPATRPRGTTWAKR